MTTIGVREIPGGIELAPALPPMRTIDVGCLVTGDTIHVPALGSFVRVQRVALGGDGTVTIQTNAGPFTLGVEQQVGVVVKAQAQRKRRGDRHANL